MKEGEGVRLFACGALVMFASVHLDASDLDAQTSNAHDLKPRRWSRAWVRYWLFEKPAAKTEPSIGPGHCSELAKFFGRGSIPERPVPRDCSAMLPAKRSAMPSPTLIPGDLLAGVPRALVQRQPALAATTRPATLLPLELPLPLALQQAAAAPVRQKGQVATPAGHAPQTPETDLSIADIMHKLVVALEQDPIPASIVHEARVTTRVSELADRLATVSRMNKPQTKNRTKARRLSKKYPAPYRLYTATSPAPRPEPVTNIDALVATAASNVVRYVTSNQQAA